MQGIERDGYAIEDQGKRTCDICTKYTRPLRRSGEIESRIEQGSSRGTQEQIGRRKIELTPWKKEVMRQPNEPKRRAEEFHTHQRKMVLESRELIRYRQEFEMRLQKVQDLGRRTNGDAAIKFGNAFTEVRGDLAPAAIAVLPGTVFRTPSIQQENCSRLRGSRESRL